MVTILDITQKRENSIWFETFRYCRATLARCHSLSCDISLSHCFINNASKEDGKQGQRPPPASSGVQRGCPSLRESTINKLEWKSAVAKLQSVKCAALHTSEKHIDTTGERAGVRQGEKEGEAFNLGCCNKWSRKWRSISTWITESGQQREAVSCSTVSPAHTLPHCCCIRLSRRPSDDSQPAPPAPHARKDAAACRLPRKLPQHQQWSKWMSKPH